MPIQIGDFTFDDDGSITINVPEGVDPQNLQAITMSAVADAQDWFPHVAHDFAHHLIGLGGEVGELMNMWKKVERGDLKFPQEDREVRLAMGSELVDILIYAVEMFNMLGIDPATLYWAKREYNEGRFGAHRNNQSGPTLEVVENK